MAHPTEIWQTSLSLSGDHSISSRCPDVLFTSLYRLVRFERALPRGINYYLLRYPISEICIIKYFILSRRVRIAIYEDCVSIYEYLFRLNNGTTCRIQ